MKKKIPEISYCVLKINSDESVDFYIERMFREQIINLPVIVLPNGDIDHVVLTPYHEKYKKHINECAFK